MQHTPPYRPLVQLNHIQVDHAGVPALHDICWSLNEGENWVIRGANGSGKSTLLKLIAGKIWPTPGQHERRVYYFNHSPEWSPIGATRQMALLSPDLQNRYLHQDWAMTAGEVIATGFQQTDLLHEELTAKEYQHLYAVVGQLDLADIYSKQFLELSQGERRKVLIARALLAKPKVLLLDEFSEGLDREANDNFHGLLYQLAGEGVTVVLSTHRPRHSALADWQELQLENGRITNDTPAGNITPATPSLFEESRSLPEATSETIIRIRRGQFYTSDRQLLKDIEWELRRGQHVAVLGPNGSGKTSFLRLLWGEQHLALGGELVRFDDPIGHTAQDIRKRTAFFHPDLHALFDPDERVEDIIVSGLFASIGLVDPVTEFQREHAERTAKIFAVNDFIGRPLKSLSYGQARRVLLARTLIARPELLLLDEPFDGLDHHAHKQITNQLKIAADNGSTLVLTCHYADDIPLWIDHAVRIQDQQLVRLRRT